MTEQIFRTVTYSLNIFSTQILSHITLFNPCSFPASLQFLSCILLLQMSQHFLHCPEKHHHTIQANLFIY